MTIMQRINLVSNELMQVNRELEKITYVSGTKAEKRQLAQDAIEVIDKNSKELERYRNVLNPLKAGDPANSIYDELQRIGEDIGTVQYLIAKGDTKEADKLLSDMKKRI